MQTTATYEAGIGAEGRGGAFVLPAALFVAFAGLFAAGVLGLGHVLEIPVPCGGSRGCAAVASHPASKMFGVPIAYAGVTAYIVLILVLLQTSERRAARLTLLLLAALGAAASAGLLIYSQMIIQATCIWCAASGAAMGLLLLLSIVILRAGRLPAVKPALFWTLAMASALAVGVQAGAMERSARRPPVPSVVLASVPLEVLLDEAKSVGPADAPVTIIIFGDPWCPACAAARRSLHSYQSANSGAVRLVHRHVMLWPQSGAVCALGEIAAEHGRYWQFIDAVYERKVPLVREGYLQLLHDLDIPTHDVEERLADVNDAAVQRVWRDQALAERLGIAATPTFIVLLDGQRPQSANQRTLRRILNSPIAQERLRQAID